MSGLEQLSIGQFLDELAGEQSGPAAGSVAAMSAAMAASLIAMSARRSKDDWSEAGGVAAQALVLRSRSLELAAGASALFASAAAALERGAGLEEPLRRSVDPLLDIADVAADVGRLAAFTAPRCERLSRADVMSAAELAESAARMAKVLVAANLGVSADDDRLAHAQRAVVDAAAATREAGEP